MFIPNLITVVELVTLYILLSDEDECSIGPPKCEQTCTNTPGSYVCYCSTGYALETDHRSCHGLNDHVEISV